MKKTVHAVAGALALATISLFWTSTVIAEIFGSAGQIAQVKYSVLWGLLILVPAMAAAGGTGFSLGRTWRHPAVARKARRMKIIAANGVLVLVPSAFFLASRAAQGNFDSWFVGVQALELIAGATNIVLLSLNMRDGLAFRSRSKATSR